MDGSSASFPVVRLRAASELRRFLCMLACSTAILVIAPATAQVRDPGIGMVPHTSNESWYSPEQAERGELSYNQHCARCHGVELEGVIGYAPALVGHTFWNRWGGRGLDRLFHFTKGLMPLDRPASLADDTYADILAFMLQENGLPPGAVDLPPDTEQIGRLTIPTEAPDQQAR